MIKLRTVRLSDAPRLAEIYRPYVESTTVTLEYDAPDAHEFERRISSIAGEFPYIVAESDGKIIGYAYAHKYRERYGYRYCAELSVYVDSDERGHGIGRVMYAKLIELARLMGLRNLYGMVVDPNPASFALHKDLGFAEVGRDKLAGFKLGGWYDIVNFELRVNADSSPAPLDKPLRFDELEPAAVAALLEPE